MEDEAPRWCAQVVDLALREMLPYSWFRRNLADMERVGLVPSGMEANPCPPELLTLLVHRIKTAHVPLMASLVLKGLAACEKSS
jgi:hypothetical protein